MGFSRPEIRQLLGISQESLRHVPKEDLHLYPYQLQIKQKRRGGHGKNMQPCVNGFAA